MLINIIKLLNPPLVIVDALMMEYKKTGLSAEKTRSNIFGLSDEEVEIEFAAFSPYSGVRGAAALTAEHYLMKGMFSFSPCFLYRMNT